MKEIARLETKDRQDLFNATSAKIGMSKEIIDKDIHALYFSV